MKTMTNLMTRRDLIRNAVAAMVIFMLVVLAGCGGDNTAASAKGGGSDRYHWVVLTSHVGTTYNMNDPWDGSVDVTFNAKYGDPVRWIYAMQKYHPSDPEVSMVRPVPVFSQNNSEWSGDPLGTNTSGVTIGSAGCAMVSVAMLLKGYGVSDVTPRTLNTWLTENEGYDPDVPDHPSDFDIIKWGVAAGYPGNVMTWADREDWGNIDADLGKIDAELDGGFPVVVKTVPIAYR